MIGFVRCGSSMLQKPFKIPVRFWEFKVKEKRRMKSEEQIYKVE